MESILINKNAYVLNGSCKGIKGNVIAADSKTEKIVLRVDNDTSITTKRNNVMQTDNYRDLPCGSKSCSDCGECDDLS